MDCGVADVDGVWCGSACCRCGSVWVDCGLAAVGGLWCGSVAAVGG